MLIACTGCDRSSPGQVQATSTTNSASGNSSLRREITKVDVATASLSQLSEARQYSGTTQPLKQVSWRSQTEGRLLELSVEVGDFVVQNQLIGKLDDRLLQGAIASKTGELAALKSELARAEIQVNNARIKLEEAKIQLQQADSEAIRYQNLAETGLIAEQQAESFKTAAKIAEKALLTAQETVKLEEQAVAIVRGRIATQNSELAQSQQLQAYSEITAPISGVVMAKNYQSGSLIRPGEEVFTMGDFNQIKIVVLVSELDLGLFNEGGKVEVQLDAFKDLDFMGKVARIAPVTNPANRQIPVEIIINNPENKIKGGLLARIKLSAAEDSRIVVPEMAVIEENGTDYIFTISQQNQKNQSKAIKRKVITGDRQNGKVKIMAGISSGDQYVIRSSKPLQDQDPVRLSIVSK